MVATLKERVSAILTELEGMSHDELVEERYRRLQKLGQLDTQS